MALWPFGKKDNDNAAKPAAPAQPDAQPDTQPAALADTPADAAAASDATEAKIISLPHDAVGGDTGPFDGDSVAIEDFNFQDFATGVLDLGSLKIALPKGSQVQVEMGPQGPKMLHIVTEFGRMTPVAFAAPRSSGQWQEAAADLLAGISGDGLSTRVESGPWGSEIVGFNDNGTIRVIGVEGPRWLLRMTLAAPVGKEDQLAALGREVIARTFVYRGEEPMLAGNSLPVVMPAALAEQVKQAMAQRAQQQAQQEAQQAIQAQVANHRKAQQQAQRQLDELDGDGPAATER